MVDAEVQPALARNPALPTTARVIGNQLLCLREVEPGLELDQGLTELLRLLFLLGQPTACLLCNQSLTHKKMTAPHSGRRTRWQRRDKSRKESSLLNKTHRIDENSSPVCLSIPPGNTAIQGEKKNEGGGTGGDLRTGLLFGHLPALGQITDCYAPVLK